MSIKRKFKLDFQWETQEPFLFCVHHLDQFPKGESHLGPATQFLKNRQMGQDFQVKDGFRMYHGEVVPGFPVHPHRGFETVTIVRKGYVDHSDSMGAAGRYGEGDVQWMTAGSGIQHSEMFPLVHQNQPNTVELFQIWLNLPQKSKMANPHFTMFWSEKIPVTKLNKDQVSVSIIAGAFNGVSALAPPPDSWASQPESEVAIWLVKMKPGASLKLPATKNLVSRTLYLFRGRNFSIGSDKVDSSTGVELISTQEDIFLNAETDSEFLILQGKPMGEPVVQYGPFVMNTNQEIKETISEYQKTQFGGWPWPEDEMTHGSVIERFAKYPDGKIEKP